MPTPTTATQGSQSENVNTPAKQPDKQTTTQPRAEENSNLMDFLDVPKEVQAQIKPKAVEPMTGDIPAEHSTVTEETPAEQPHPPEHQSQLESQPQPEAILDDDDDDDDDDDITGQNNEAASAETASQQQQPQKIDKRQKRINRLTRKLAERDSQIDTLFQQLTDLKGKAKHDEADVPSTVPSAGGWLPNITNEPQLDQEVSKARDLINWCNENAEGVTSGEGENQKFVSPKEIAGFKTRAEMVVLGSETRRRELREFSANRDKYDVLAKQAWPEMFDNSSEEHQLAQSLLESNPELKSRVDKNYALGILVEGVKSLHGRVQAAAKNVAAGNTNGNGVRTNERRDISPRAFEPRVPLAPGGPEAPTREVVPSSHKKLNEAMTQLVADPDGSVNALANILSALDDSKRTRAGSRTPVAV